MNSYMERMMKSEQIRGFVKRLEWAMNEGIITAHDGLDDVRLQATISVMLDKVDAKKVSRHQLYVPTRFFKQVREALPAKNPLNNQIIMYISEDCAKDALEIAKKGIQVNVLKGMQKEVPFIFMSDIELERENREQHLMMCHGKSDGCYFVNVHANKDPNIQNALQSCKTCFDLCTVGSVSLTEWQQQIKMQSIRNFKNAREGR